MSPKSKDDHLHAILAKAKVLLIVLSATLFIINLYFLTSTRQLAASYNEQQNQATWFLFQLNKEFSELRAITPFAADSEEYYDRTLLKYELTWSRFDILLSSKEADNLITLPGAAAFFSDLFSQFKQLEPELIALNSPDQAKALCDDIDALYMSMIQYVNTNFRIKSPLYLSQMSQAQSLTQAQFVLMVLLFVCACLVGYIIHKEAIYHKQLALTDSLTGVSNRLAMFNDMAEWVEQGQSFNLYLLDLNGFKEVNDRHGHQAGDEVLATVAHRLNRLEAYCYRIGGDEFALVYLGDTHPQHHWKQIESCFRKTIAIRAGTQVFLSTSIGTAHYPHDGASLSRLISIADANMYEMKFAKLEQKSIG